MMMNKRNLSTLLAGVVLTALGVLFLAVNVYQVEIDWMMGLKLVFPALLIWAGAMKLVRHFTWPQDELTRRPGKAGLLSGIFWLSLGVVLALSLFSVLEFLSTAGFYWPVVLLLFGVGKIIDFFRMREISRSNFAEIAGVIFIALFGIGCMKLHQLNTLILEQDPFWNRIPELVGIEELMDPLVENSTTEEFDLEGVTTVEVRNSYGDISIEGVAAPEPSGSVELISSIRESDQARAEAIFGKVSVEFRKEDGRLLISTNRQALKSQGKRLSTSMNINLPEEISLNVENDYGDIKVYGLKGGCVLDADKGEVRVATLEGDLRVLSDSEAVILQDIAGNASVEARFSEIDISEVTGNVTVVSSHKPVKVRGIRGDLKIENRHDDVEVEDISGNVDIDNPGGRISLSGVTGGMKLVNSRGDVKVVDSSGPLVLTTAYGDVTLAGLQSNVEVTSRHADIEGRELGSDVTIRAQTSAVDLEGPGGNLIIETSQEDVRVVDASGSVNIQNDLGQVTLEFSKSPAGDIRIESRQGDIALTLPGDASCVIDARVDSGKILSDFGNPPSQDARGDSVFETEIGQGGPRVNLLTSGSLIEIRSN